MDMRIVIRGVDDTSSLRSFAEEKLEHGLNRFKDAVLGATMRLEDVTGPEKGGVDKQCNIEVRLRTGDVRIKEQGSDFHATIDSALDRLKVAMRRKIGKTKRGIGEG